MEERTNNPNAKPNITLNKMGMRTHPADPRQISFYYTPAKCAPHKTTFLSSRLSRPQIGLQSRARGRGKWKWREKHTNDRQRTTKNFFCTFNCAPPVQILEFPLFSSLFCRILHFPHRHFADFTGPFIAQT